MYHRYSLLIISILGKFYTASLSKKKLGEKINHVSYNIIIITLVYHTKILNCLFYDVLMLFRAALAYLAEQVNLDGCGEQEIVKLQSEISEMRRAQ